MTARTGAAPIRVRPDGSPIEHDLGIMVVSRSYTAIIDRLVAPSANYRV